MEQATGMHLVPPAVDEGAGGHDGVRHGHGPAPLPARADRYQRPHSTCTVCQLLSSDALSIYCDRSMGPSEHRHSVSRAQWCHRADLIEGAGQGELVEGARAVEDDDEDDRGGGLVERRQAPEGRDVENTRAGRHRMNCKPLDVAYHWGGTVGNVEARTNIHGLRGLPFFTAFRACSLGEAPNQNLDVAAVPLLLTFWNVRMFVAAA
mmetsp:Transcript_4748/g.14529  ORF Transcript_4748/g.14529 Transcript_4748/m.14529 type:complete len:207 (-) Transcript_4748:2239-2859(-)